MKTLAPAQESDSLRSTVRSAPPPASSVLAQRRSTLGGGGSVAAPAITDRGSPLDATTRGAMETGFGRDFSGIRVHDDARAHDDARSLGARAYTAGDHIVFAQGAYRPETSSGRALIAHELAHSIQQGGVLTKADGSHPTTKDGELEGQAERAALDVTAGRKVSGLSRLGRPTIFRSEGDPPVSAPAKTPEAAGTATDLPTGARIVSQTPKGGDPVFLEVAVPTLELPRPKGFGGWVEKAYKDAARGKGEGLVFNSVVQDGKITPFKEEPGEQYKDIWLNNYGFKDLPSLAAAIGAAAENKPTVRDAIKNKETKRIIKELAAGSLLNARCDVDHIVEKQLGGTSIPSNLQLLVASKNRAAGSATKAALQAQAKEILGPKRKSVRHLWIRFEDVIVKPDSEDGSFVIENLLRLGDVSGSPDVIKRGEGTPIQLVVPGKSEVVRVRENAATPIDKSVRSMIPGLKLTTYHRSKNSGPTKGTDTVKAVIASELIVQDKQEITLTAIVAPAPESDPSTKAGVSATEKASAVETRKLKLNKKDNADIAFFYPYLSRGKLSLELDDQNQLTGTGELTPTVKFLGKLKVRFAPEKFELVQPIDTEAINSSEFMKHASSFFRFTKADVSINLVKFKPDGNLSFEVGPRGRPVILGSVKATEEGGHFVATGDLLPAGTIPGIKEAKGKVTYRSDTGWSGELKVESSSISGLQPTVVLGFREVGERFIPYGQGDISTTVRKARLNLSVRWSGGDLSYHGKVDVEDPLPLVNKVSLEGDYAKNLIRLKGNAKIQWKRLDATMDVTYERKDDDPEGKFGGHAHIDIKTEKASGAIDLKYSESKFTGGGEISYQVTKDIRPKLGIAEDSKGRLKVSGTVVIGDIPLTRMWPAPDGGTITFIKGAGAKIRVPIPPLSPVVDAIGEIKVAAGLGYGVGPVVLTGVTFRGSLLPLEDEPEIEAHLKGMLVVPAYAKLYGKFGAYLGVEVAGGLVGAKGGVEISPTLQVTGKAELEVNVDYLQKTFTFSAEARARGQMEALLDIDLVAEVSAGYGIFEYEWKWKVKEYRQKLGPELILTLGKVGYGEGGKLTLPDPSQISLEPKELNPLDLVQELLRKPKATKK